MAAFLAPSQTLTPQQVEQLWTRNGGSPAWAPLMAAIAMAESGGQTGILNDNPATGDYSVGLWQVNYFGRLAGSRTARYGAPAALAADPNAQAKAAIDLLGNGAGISNWKGDAAYKAWQAGQPLSGVTGPLPDPTDPTATPASFVDIPNDINPGYWVGKLLSSANPLDTIGNFLKAIHWIINPMSWLRIVAGVLGFVLGGFGVYAFATAV